jgi:Fe-S oxidoreductase
MQFSMRPIDETIEDIRQQAQFYQGKKINSCFLQDGDALVLKTDYLLRILDAINQYFPDIQYIGKSNGSIPQVEMLSLLLSIQ